MSIAAKYGPHYTYDEYCQWEGNWELVEGIPYAMSPAPAPVHQRVSILPGIQFERALEKCKKRKVYAPVDWKIAGDMVVQPDLLIVCDKIEKKFLDFTPALVVEIVSSATASKDRDGEMELYRAQQVKYFLIVDPRFKKVEIYEYLLNHYQPVALNPEIYLFTLPDNCTTEVNLLDIWD